MYQSLTTTTITTAVASQRLLPTPRIPEIHKQLTLRLDPITQPYSQTHTIQPRTGSAQAYGMPVVHISQLPVELLSHIFLLSAHTSEPDNTLEDESSAHQDNRDDISPCLASSGTSPDVFVAVNRHWRQVAIGTPQLWTRICVTIGDVMRREMPFAAVSRYVSRSGKCSLDILIDARDPEWDFSEADSVGAVISPYIDELYDYTHPFRVEHMHHVLNILLPHVQRFRSLAILTDRWAPMQTALDCLSMEISAFVTTPSPLPSKIPLLETLVLMRCNEFVGYSSEFSPADRKDFACLPFSALMGHPEVELCEPVLPRLKKLVLSGVHTQWPSLPHLLSPPQSAHPSTLETLELSYHCSEVRPAERDFRALLERCTKLRKLSIRVSGPKPPGPDSAHTCTHARAEVPLLMPELETIVIGYDDPYVAGTVLDLIDAPHARQVMLEESSSPGRDGSESDPTAYDSGSSS